MPGNAKALVVIRSQEIRKVRVRKLQKKSYARHRLPQSSSVIWIWKHLSIPTYYFWLHMHVFGSFACS